MRPPLLYSFCEMKSTWTRKKHAIITSVGKAARSSESFRVKNSGLTRKVEQRRDGVTGTTQGTCLYQEGLAETFRYQIRSLRPVHPPVVNNFLLVHLGFMPDVLSI